MDKEKQIEEMAKTMCNCYDSGNCKMHGHLCDLKCISGFNALGLYNAGYRKASEVAREIFEEFGKYISPHKIGAFNCIYINDVIYELKKKYTEVDNEK